MDRNQHSLGWKLKLAVFVAAASVAGVATGALLGLAGSALSADARIGLATLLGVVALALGLWETLGSRVVPLQCNRETPQAWVSRGPLPWAVRNGLALGFAGGSRLGFTLWYAVPAGSFLMGNPLLGACIYGAFATTRAAGAGVLMLAGRYSGDFQLVTEWLFARAGLARLGAACQLIGVGVAVMIGIGS